MTRLDEMLQANEAYCKNPPVDYTDEDVHESKLRENPLLQVCRRRSHDGRSKKEP